jgi:hypothetical protein
LFYYQELKKEQAAWLTTLVLIRINRNICPLPSQRLVQKSQN